MRPALTWLVVGSLLVVGLFAARDAITKGSEPVVPTAADTQPAPPPPQGPPPAIPGRERLVSALAGLGAQGALYLTDVRCRRFVLSLPALRWAAPGRQPTDCGLWSRPPVEADSGIAAKQVNADTIEVTSGGWSYAFEGSAPAFKPDGTLTFVRDGRLYEWTARCPAKAQIIRFQELHDVPRCVEPISGAPRGLREVAWLAEDRYAAVAGPDGAMSVVVVGVGTERRLFTGVGTRVGALEASPAGGYVAARLDGAFALFRTASSGIRPLPRTDELVRGIAWSPDDRLAALVMESSVQVFRVTRPQRSVTLPLSVAAARWR
jgi:hypothetical protein